MPDQFLKSSEDSKTVEKTALAVYPIYEVKSALNLGQKATFFALFLNIFPCKQNFANIFTWKALILFILNTGIKSFNVWCPKFEQNF